MICARNTITNMTPTAARYPRPTLAAKREDGDEKPGHDRGGQQPTQAQPCGRARPTGQPQRSADPEPEEIGLDGQQAAPEAGDRELRDDDRGTRRWQGEQVLRGVVTELAAEDPDQDHAEDQRAADRGGLRQ